jgi:hydroxyacylglutathione hydrolase
MPDIFGLTAFEDNYIWGLTSPSNPSRFWVVDPGDAEPVLNYAKQNQATLAGILITHHHWDHTQGVNALKQAFPQCEVVASLKTQAKLPDLPIDFTVKQGDKVSAAGRVFEVIEVPGHTLDHIALFSQSNGDPILFSGDTLFTAGCGRVFEGTAEQMAQSLLKLRALPDETSVFCGHEYTLANINFAAIAEPTNELVLQRQQEVIQKTLAGEPCVPEKLGVEKQTNPFLRFHLDPLRTTLYNKKLDINPHAPLKPTPEDLTPGELFALVRAWKDQLDETGELERIPPQP